MGDGAAVEVRGLKVAYGPRTILDGVDTWVVDVTRERPHISHAHLDLALQWVERLKPRRTILTHMNHTLDYATLAAKLPPGVEPGQDGLVMEF